MPNVFFLLKQAYFHVVNIFACLNHLLYIILNVWDTFCSQQTTFYGHLRALQHHQMFQLDKIY